MPNLPTIPGSVLVTLPLALLQQRTLNRALEDLELTELDGPNDSPRIRQFTANLDPPLSFPIPYCAAGVQCWSDEAARSLGVPNPLDAVVREAFVADYFDWANQRHLLVPAAEAVAGDLILFSFGGRRFDHMGLVWFQLPGVWVRTVEANTGPASGSQRDGDGIYSKDRRTDQHQTVIVRWGMAT